MAGGWEPFDQERAPSAGLGMAALLVAIGLLLLLAAVAAIVIVVGTIAGIVGLS
jgi:hypothetical protein